MSDGTRSENSEAGRGKGGTPLLIAGAVVIVILLGVIAVLVIRLRQPAAPEPENSGGALRGVLVSEDNVREVIAQAEEPPVPMGSYEVTMNPTWHFPDGDSASTDAYVENAAANTNDVYFDIQLPDTEEVIYESPVIPRGMSLENIQLNRHMEPGNYDATVVYHLVDDNQKTISTVRVNVWLIIAG